MMPVKIAEERASGVQVIARAALVLRALAKHPDGLSLGGISKIIGLPRSTVQRIVFALEVEGFVETGSGPGSIRLGLGLGQLTTHLHLDMSGLARPHLERLSLASAETVVLASASGGEMTPVHMVISEQQLRIVPPTPLRLPMYAVSEGKVLLARLTDTDVRDLLGTPLEKLTANTCVDIGKLLKELVAVRSTGFAFDREEHTVGICSISIAVEMPLGAYAVSTLVPTIRFEQKIPLLKTKLLECKRAIEADL